MYENSIKNIIKQNWDDSSKNYDYSPRNSVHSEKEKMAWKNLLTLGIGSKKQKILNVGSGAGVLAEMGHDVIEIK